jgi:hypothetical protein
LLYDNLLITISIFLALLNFFFDSKFIRVVFYFQLVILLLLNSEARSYDFDNIVNISRDCDYSLGYCNPAYAIVKYPSVFLGVTINTILCFTWVISLYLFECSVIKLIANNGKYTQSHPILSFFLFTPFVIYSVTFTYRTLLALSLVLIAISFLIAKKPKFLLSILTFFVSTYIHAAFIPSSFLLLYAKKNISRRAINFVRYAVGIFFILSILFNIFGGYQFILNNTLLPIELINYFERDEFGAGTVYLLFINAIFIFYFIFNKLKTLTLVEELLFQSNIVFAALSIFTLKFSSIAAFRFYLIADILLVIFFYLRNGVVNFKFFVRKSADLFEKFYLAVKILVVLGLGFFVSWPL